MGAEAIAEAGSSDLAEVRHLDYRDVPETDFDAVCSIGLTEHIGKAQPPRYFCVPVRQARPGGRLLNHCITRPDDTEPTRQRGGFIDRYVFPDGELEGLGHLISRDAGQRLRGPARGEPARALRHDAAPAGATTSRPTGTRRSPRSARARPGSGGCTWPARGSASSATRSSCTRSSASSSHDDGDVRHAAAPRLGAVGRLA